MSVPFRALDISNRQQKENQPEALVSSNRFLAPSASTKPKISSTSDKAKASPRLLPPPPIDRDEEIWGRIQKRDILELCQPVLDEIRQILQFNTNSTEESWYEDLTYQLEVFQDVSTKVSTRQELLNYGIIYQPFVEPENCVDPNLCGRFKTMEGLRSDLCRNLESGISSPSYFGYSFIWEKGAGPRTRRGPNPPTLAIEFYHPAFYIFSETLKQPPPINDEKFNMVAAVSFKLLKAMAKFYTSHSERRNDFKKLLTLIIPDDLDCKWDDDDNDSGGSSSSQMVFRHCESLAPLLMVDVVAEFGTGGDPFYRNGRLYQMDVDSKEAVRESGAPAFLLQLCGTHLGVASGIYDTKDGLPVTHQYGGYVHLELDSGQNISETARTLYALKEALPILSRARRSAEHQVPDKPDLPRIYPSHIQPEEALSPGVLFKATMGSRRQTTNNDILLASQQAQIERLTQQLKQAEERLAQDKRHFQMMNDSVGNPAQPDRPTTVMTKIVASGYGVDRYGFGLHQFLAKQNMAPLLYSAPAIQGKPTSIPIAQICVMEYLEPPSDNVKNTGWITLEDLSQEFPSVARAHCGRIKMAIRKIVSVIHQGGFVHGDLQPKNFMVKVTLAKTDNTCFLECCPADQDEQDDEDEDEDTDDEPEGDSDDDESEYDDDDEGEDEQQEDNKLPLPYLKLIKFSWAGKVGEAYYPANRDPSVHWPLSSQNGDLMILPSHDLGMVMSWLKQWPQLGTELIPGPPAVLTYVPAC